MSGATLRVIPNDRTYGPAGTRYEVDCKHATTGLTVLHGTGETPPDLAKAMVVARHYAEEGCQCTRQLRLQYLTVRVA